MSVGIAKGLHLHFDCVSGAAGDMLLGALVDLGVPEEVVREAVREAGVDPAVLEVGRVVRGGVAARKVRVHEHGHEHEHEHGHGHGHVHWGELRGRVKGLAREIFGKLAEAEAKVHGVGVEDVAFHEVGAIDSIVDVVGTAAAIEWLAPAGVTSSVVATGSGTVKGDHGVMPVPPPAVVELARMAGMPTVGGGVARELLTPTGAAILATVVRGWGEMPAMIVRGAGYGAGDAELKDRANVVRAVLGEVGGGAGGVVVLEANLDDMSPELCEHVADRLFAVGALDVWWTPVVMKKSRPAFVLGVMAAPSAREAVTRVVLTETTSLGVRWRAMERVALERRSEVVETAFGPVSVKLGVWDGAVVNVAPEFESARKLAAEKQVPLKDVYAAALAAYRR